MRLINLDRYYFGARFYDASLGRFASIDRFSEKYFLLSPYQYGANSPVNFIDINGDSLMLFKNGVYVSTADDGKEELTGFNQRSETDKDGNEKFTGGDSFSFNDADSKEDQNIIEALKRGDAELNFLSKSQIDNAVKDATEQDVYSRWLYALNESGASGDMDFFSNSHLIKKMTFTVANGVAYNPKDAGNHVWGYAMRKMGYHESTARLAAHIRAFGWGKVDNGMGSKNPNRFVRFFDNLTWGGDSEDDQRAIIHGMKSAGGLWDNWKKTVTNTFD